MASPARYTSIGQLVHAVYAVAAEAGIASDDSPIAALDPIYVGASIRLEIDKGQLTGQATRVTGTGVAEWSHEWRIVLSLPWNTLTQSADQVLFLDLLQRFQVQCARSSAWRDLDADALISGYDVEVDGDMLRASLALVIVHTIPLQTPDERS